MAACDPELITRGDRDDQKSDRDHDRNLDLNIRGDQGLEGRNRWEKALIAFTLLKNKIPITPIL